VERIALFPLRSVLCPGVALPLHIFEERYRLMVDRCLERDEAFGVVLLRTGHEDGPLDGEIASVGTMAAIRRAGRYPDGRLDILTVGQQRFRLEAVDSVSEPYLVGDVRFLDEPRGPEGEARLRAERVGRRFLEYLELMQPPEAVDLPGSEVEVEVEVEIDDAAEDEPGAAGAPPPWPFPIAVPETDVASRVDPLRAPDSASPDAGETLIGGLDASALTPEQRRELLMAAARRLTAVDDPTTLSYVLTALIQVDLSSRQALLEAPTTVARLIGLDGLLGRESWLLRQGLRPILIDPAHLPRRDG
jgi:Lon protease-like protein